MFINKVSKIKKTKHWWEKVTMTSKTYVKQKQRPLVAKVLNSAENNS